MLTVAQSDFERSARLTAFLTWPRVGSRTGCVVGAAIEAAGSVQREYRCGQCEPHEIDDIDLVTD